MKSIKAPTSKSYAQRALAAALLAPGVSRLTNMQLCNDTASALEVIERLGAKVIDKQGFDYQIQGGLNPLNNRLDIGESGLATRLFTPIAALSPREITITGEGSIMTRPIGFMEQTLRELGVEVSSNNGTLPLSVRGRIRGGAITTDGSLSSQFITGLLMALPLAENDTTLEVVDLQSIPYIDMTLEVVRHFGIEITHDNYRTFRIAARQQYQATTYNIEGDWSGASCLLVAGAIHQPIRIENLQENSLQADRRILEALRQAGAQVEVTTDTVTVSPPEDGHLRAFEMDATHCPDLFPALAALAARSHGTTVIKGANRLTHKESDRAMTIAAEFEKLGTVIDISQDDLMIVHGIDNCRPLPEGAIVCDSHNDHRIAMAVAVMGLVVENKVTVLRPQAVNKSYPEFWHDIERL